MTTRTIFAALIVAATLPLSGVTPAGANSGELTSAQVATIVLSEIERRIIGDYYQRRYDVWVADTQGGKGKKHKGLPPGLAKKGKLPPGLAKQLARNGRLPPGLEKRYLPEDVVVQLRPRPAGYEFVIVDNRVLLIQAATNLILDVLTVAAADAS